MKQQTTLSNINVHVFPVTVKENLELFDANSHSLIKLRKDEAYRAISVHSGLVSHEGKFILVNDRQILDVIIDYKCV